MYLKDSKGNLHQNALVIQSLSQNLTSHTQFVEQGHLLYFHKSGSGIVTVLNKVPKFNLEDVIIPFVDGPGPMNYSMLKCIFQRKKQLWLWLQRDY